MKIKQIAIFMENKPGYLQSICEALGQANLNISTHSLADTTQMGIARFIIEDWQKAQKILEKAGFAVNVTDVMAVEMEDKPKALLNILNILAKAQINIEYMYTFTVGYGHKAIMIFKFNDADAAKAGKALADQKIKILAEADLFRRIN